MNFRSLRSLTGVALAAGCAGKPAAPPPPPPAPPPSPNIVSIHAGPSPHHVQLVKLGDGKTFADLMGALKNSGPPPAWMGLVAGPNTPMPPTDTTSATVTLEPGHYALICMIPDQNRVPHFALGMAQPLEVTPVAGPVAAEPAADLEIGLVDYAFSESAPLTAGAHTIRVVNNGQQPHEVLIVRLDGKATAAGLAHWVEGAMKGPPPTGVRLMGGTAAMMPGSHTLVNVKLATGTYGLLCFVPDIKDGKEHTRHGMIKELKVS